MNRKLLFPAIAAGPGGLLFGFDTALISGAEQAGVLVLFLFYRPGRFGCRRFFRVGADVHCRNNACQSGVGVVVPSVLKVRLNDLFHISLDRRVANKIKRRWSPKK